MKTFREYIDLISESTTVDDEWFKDGAFKTTIVQQEVSFGNQKRLVLLKIQMTLKMLVML